MNEALATYSMLAADDRSPTTTNLLRALTDRRIEEPFKSHDELVAHLRLVNRAQASALLAHEGGDSLRYLYRSDQEHRERVERLRREFEPPMGPMTYPNPSERFSKKDFMMKMPDGSWEPAEKLFREGRGDEISQVICTMVQSKELSEYNLETFYLAIKAMDSFNIEEREFGFHCIFEPAYCLILKKLHQ